MSEPFLAEIIMFGGNFPPRGWAQCDGQLLSISQNTSLFSLLGTSYGGDGRNTFALPDLRGRVPIHPPSSSRLKGGAERVTLVANQLPAHHHPVLASRTSATTGALAGNVHATVSSLNLIYAEPSNLVAMSDAGVGDNIGGQAHPNMQPFLVLTFIIALQGLFPSRN